jgi:hypothetical protein
MMSGGTLKDALMPAKPRWYGTLEQVITELEALPRPAVDRGTLQFLLGIGPRRAQQLMAACVTERVGTSSLADRQLLIAHLRRLAAGDAGHYERHRRHKLAATLEQFRRAWLDHPRVLVEAPVDMMNQDFADLPPGVDLQPGEIRIRFDHPTQALEKLLALAMAIGNDREGFERRAAASPSHHGS